MKGRAPDMKGNIWLDFELITEFIKWGQQSSIFCAQSTDEELHVLKKNGLALKSSPYKLYSIETRCARHTSS
jgi:hypothetical protein